jgi:hypothetical protein
VATAPIPSRCMPAFSTCRTWGFSVGGLL